MQQYLMYRASENKIIVIIYILQYVLNVLKVSYTIYTLGV